MRNEVPEGLVLDEAESPGGALQLVAFQEKGTVWIGVKAKGSPLKEAIGLHTGSSEHYVEGSRLDPPHLGSGVRRRLTGDRTR